MIETSLDSLEKWKAEVDRLFLRAYAIDSELAGIDSAWLLTHFESHQAPSEFVAWYAAKYDLIDFGSVDFIPRVRA